jgi:hypothetical protein
VRRDLVAGHADRAQQPVQGFGGFDPRDGRGVAVQVQEQLTVRERGGQPMRGMYGKRGLADAGHAVDHADDARACAAGRIRPGRAGLGVRVGRYEGQQPAQLRLAAGEVGGVQRELRRAGRCRAVVVQQVPVGVVDGPGRVEPELVGVAPAALVRGDRLAAPAGGVQRANQQRHQSFVDGVISGHPRQQRYHPVGAAAGQLDRRHRFDGREPAPLHLDADGVERGTDVGQGRAVPQRQALPEEPGRVVEFGRVLRHPRRADQAPEPVPVDRLLVHLEQVARLASDQLDIGTGAGLPKCGAQPRYVVGHELLSGPRHGVRLGSPDQPDDVRSTDDGIRPEQQHRQHGALPARQLETVPVLLRGYVAEKREVHVSARAPPAQPRRAGAPARWPRDDGPC